MILPWFRMGKRAEVIKVNEVVALYRLMAPFHSATAGKREEEKSLLPSRLDDTVHSLMQYEISS